MSLSNKRVLVIATALLTAPLLPGWAQAPVHPRPQPKKPAAKGEVIVKSDTPADQDPQVPQGQQPATQDQGTAAQGQQQQPAAQGQGGQPAPQDQGQAQGQGTAPGQAAAREGGSPPGPVGPPFPPPEGVQQGYPT